LTSHNEIVPSAAYIQSKTGAWPDLFAYPNGAASTGIQTYFANYPSEHGTMAAFTTEPNYVTRSSSRYLLPRFVYGGAWVPWVTTNDFETILNGAGY
jgi:hypothetical protein